MTRFNQIYNVNIEEQYPLPLPEELHREMPLSQEMLETIAYSRQSVEQIIQRKDRRLLVIAGPCSVDHVDLAAEYADRLRELQKKVSDKFCLVMRAYFEKPRTVLGWKGLIYDPDLDKTFNIEKGLRLSRRVLLDIAGKGLPAATEFLEPTIPQYISDLISWAAIGARTTESQTHRQLASGMSMPVGFKNSTDGSISVAIDAIKTAAARHSFLGVMSDGRPGVFRTRGNRNCHMVLRGSAQEPNFGSEYIAFTRELMKKSGLTPSIVVDCSHGNSHRIPAKQVEVLNDVVAQINAGETSISGVMLESYLKTGKQDIAANPFVRGLSVTDACLGWEETEEALLAAHRNLK